MPADPSHHAGSDVGYVDGFAGTNCGSDIQGGFASDNGYADIGCIDDFTGTNSGSDIQGGFASDNGYADIGCTNGFAGTNCGSNVEGDAGVEDHSDKNGHASVYLQHLQALCKGRFTGTP